MAEETGKETNVEYKKNKIKSILSSSTEEEVNDIIKLINHYKRSD